MATTTQVSTVEADGLTIFYRTAGPSAPTAPTVLLLHGFPSSSHMFRNLIPLLASRGYRVVAPDLPGFGFTAVPAARRYAYTFASLAATLAAFADALALRRYAIYVFDYGSPSGLRLALSRPAAVAAVVTQNGNAYAEGFGAGFWAPVRDFWASPGAPADREALGAMALSPEAVRWQYQNGSPHPARLQPEAWTLDLALLGEPGRAEAQLDLFYDYRTNVALYPDFQKFLRESGVPVLAVWGKNDEIFVPAGAEAFARDVEKFELRWLDAGHFALETNEEEVAEAMHAFFQKYHVF
ncbi:Hydrolase [Pleurostoma richardsiae]|uniref:Hydrolase n=1 Tax=Pleurostoma richardsiae TaxID=41990 RepID=A0AA38RNR2_9PEZI|nr:Hydrolase [Pleurostoma richardsiae]